MHKTLLTISFATIALLGCSEEGGPSGGSGGTTSTGGSGGAGGAACQPPTSACDGACVDLATDPAHCGSCAHDCLGGTCSAGA